MGEDVYHEDVLRHPAFCYRGPDRELIERGLFAVRDPDGPMTSAGVLTPPGARARHLDTLLEWAHARAGAVAELERTRKAVLERARQAAALDMWRQDLDRLADDLAWMGAALPVRQPRPTWQQAAVARAIAREHMHHWAEVDATDGVLDPAEIRRLASDAHPDNTPEGIMAPEVRVAISGDNVITHRTSTGRIRWWIWPDGAVDVGVYRPGDVACLFGRLCPYDPAYPGGGQGAIIDAGETPAHGRHIDAMLRVFRAAMQVHSVFPPDTGESIEAMATKAVDAAAKAGGGGEP